MFYFERELFFCLEERINEACERADTKRSASDWIWPEHSTPICLQYLLKVNEIKIKKGVDLLQNLIKYFYAQCK